MLSRSSALWSDPSRSARRSFRYRPRTQRARQPRSRPRRCCAHRRRAPPDRSRSARPDTPFPRITAPAVSGPAPVTIPKTGNRLPLSCCRSDYWSSGLFLRRRNDRQPHRAGTREHSPSVTPSFAARALDARLSVDAFLPGGPRERVTLRLMSGERFTWASTCLRRRVRRYTRRCRARCMRLRTMRHGSTTDR